MRQSPVRQVGRILRGAGLGWAIDAALRAGRSASAGLQDLRLYGGWRLGGRGFRAKAFERHLNTTCWSLLRSEQASQRQVFAESKRAAFRALALKNWRITLRFIRRLQKDHMHASALELLRSCLLELRPKSPYLNALVVRSLEALRRFDLAVRWPGQRSPRTRAILALAAGDRGTAITDLRRWLAAEPASLEARRALAKCLAEEASPEEAIRILESNLPSLPLAAENHRMLAELCGRLGNAQRASELSATASRLALQGEHPVLHLRTDPALLEFLEAFRSAHEVTPGKVLADFNYGFSSASSLYFALRLLFEDWEVFSSAMDRPLRNFRPPLQDAATITGNGVRYVHTGHDFMLYAGGDFFQYTILRDPVKVFLSSFWWTHRAAPDAVQKGWESLRAWHDAYEPGRASTRLSPLLDAEELNLDESGMIRALNGKLEGSFHLVGINDYFDETLAVLCLLNGFDRLPFWHGYGASGSAKPSEVPRDIMEGILEATSVDRAVFARQRERFEQRFGPAIAMFRQRIGSLEAANRTRFSGPPVS